MLTAPEVEFLRESNNIEKEWDDKSLQDAILAWQWLKPKKKLTKTLILDIHQILMDTRDTLQQQDKGAFRNGPVWIGGREGKPWFVVPELIEQWLVVVNDRIVTFSQEKDWTLEEKVANIQDDHVQYERIHPFFDGNGRTGRIFYNWERIRCGLPIHIIKEERKYEYYKWFQV